MKRMLSLLMLIVSVLSLQSQEVGEGKYLKGKIRGEYDSTFLAGVHVININTRIGTVTNAEGQFQLEVNEGNRVLFSYLGFELDTLHITDALTSDTIIEVILKETTYLLSIFDALSIKTFEDFERAFLALELPNQELNFTMPKPDIYQSMPQNPAFTIAVPFDLSYFTKKARDLRRYQAVLEKDKYNEIIQMRYNAKVVEKVTGITDPEKIEELMDYCHFSDQFIRNAIDYDLYVAIIECSQKYMKKKRVLVPEKEKQD